MLTSRCAFMLLFFIAACGPLKISILAAARPLGNIKCSNSHPHDTLSTVPRNRFSSCRSTEAFDCGAFSGDNTVDSKHDIETYITTEVGDNIAAAGVLESQNTGEVNDQSSYDILTGSTSPPGSPPSINHAAGNSVVASTSSSYDILRGSTSPPGSPHSINHAVINDQSTSSSYDILRSSTSPPGSPPSINHAADNSVASTSSSYDILRTSTSPPGSPISINHAAGNSGVLGLAEDLALPTISEQ